MILRMMIIGRNVHKYKESLKTNKPFACHTF